MVWEKALPLSLRATNFFDHVAAGPVPLGELGSDEEVSRRKQSVDSSPWTWQFYS
jgi:hypothetical protein